MVSLSRRNSERCSEIEKMKNKREDRFEAIVDQFVKNDLIAQEEYSYYLYGVKHLEVLIMTTGGVLLSGILLRIFNRRISIRWKSLQRTDRSAFTNILQLFRIVPRSVRKSAGRL